MDGKVQKCQNDINNKTLRVYGCQHRRSLCKKYLTLKNFIKNLQKIYIKQANITHIT